MGQKGNKGNKAKKGPKWLTKLNFTRHLSHPSENDFFCLQNSAQLHTVDRILKNNTNYCKIAMYSKCALLFRECKKKNLQKGAGLKNKYLHQNSPPRHQKKNTVFYGLGCQLRKK